MRGIGHTLSRLPAARAWLAGAAILAGALASAAHAGAPGSGNGTGNDETAMAIPRISLRGANAGISLPQPLSPSDAALMRRAFDLQNHGNIPAASRLADEVHDPLLLGHFLADRYLGRYHRSTVAELTAWLDRYGNQPDAPAIRALLLNRLPKGASVPPVAAADALAPVPVQTEIADDADLQTSAVARNPALDNAVAARLRRGATRAALALIAAERGLHPDYAALLRGEVARWLFTHNDDDAALNTAYIALHDTAPDQQVGLPAYVGGLAAWRLGRVDEARGLFELAAGAPLASARIRAAAAFWAARAGRQLHDPAAVRHWLHLAATQRVTLYGLLARQRIGLPTGIIPSGELLSQADIDVVADTAPGWRAFALMQIGQPDPAEAELRLLWPRWQNSPAEQRSLMLVASALDLNDLAAQIADIDASADGGAANALRFPVPRLHPDGGFRIDPALVYAVTRVESNFDAGAISSAGARGLMQIMPVTAQYISGNASLSAERLHNPSLNLALGQRYITYLARQDCVGNDLLHVLASYNDGPNGLAHWSADVRDNGDPLLFIEAIPNDQTRAFVDHALTYTWLYAARLHLPAPSLDQLAAGEWPRFTPAADRSKIAFVAPRVH
jgi:soluble lytic murein transglycosylase